ncbi:hypothetical protein BZA77DRAFT_348773 [Pyronema omphalodes]|nr:hypothetical protein BZA77DRAFT_348773 [Pyronema omphalodes]
MSGFYTFRWDRPATEVYVTGTFDNWSRSTKLEKEGDVFTKRVELPTDKNVTYKFVVDGDWVIDPNAPIDTDENGIQNNLITKESIEVPDMSQATINSVAPESSTAALAGAVPKESEVNNAIISSVAPDATTAALIEDIALEATPTPGASDVPGGFPETPAVEKIDPTPASTEQIFSVKPIPASETAENPIQLLPGEPVPEIVGTQTIHSNVKLDKESYEKGATNFPLSNFVLPEVVTPAELRAAEGRGVLDIPKNLIPESSLPIVSAAEAEAAAASNVEVPEIVKESQEAALASPEASAVPETVAIKAEVEEELKHEVPAIPATTEGNTAIVAAQEVATETAIETKEVANQAAVQAQEIAVTAAEKTQEIASVAAEKTQEIASAAAEQAKEVAVAAAVQAQETATKVVDQVAEVTASAIEQAPAVAEKAAETATAVTGAAVEVATQAKDAVVDAAAQASEVAASTAIQAKDAAIALTAGAVGAGGIAGAVALSQEPEPVSDVPEIVRNSIAEAGVPAEAAAVEEAVEQKVEVEHELKEEVSEIPATVETVVPKDQADINAEKIATQTAPIVTDGIVEQETTAQVIAHDKPEESVPEVVKESIAEAGVMAEAAAEPVAVGQKEAVEEELKQVVEEAAPIAAATTDIRALDINPGPNALPISETLPAPAEPIVLAAPVTAEPMETAVVPEPVTAEVVAPVEPVVQEVVSIEPTIPVAAANGDAAAASAKPTEPVAATEAPADVAAAVTEPPVAAPAAPAAVATNGHVNGTAATETSTPPQTSNGTLDESPKTSSENGSTGSSKNKRRSFFGRLKDRLMGKSE